MKIRHVCNQLPDVGPTFFKVGLMVSGVRWHYKWNVGPWNALAVKLWIKSTPLEKRDYC